MDDPRATRRSNTNNRSVHRARSAHLLLQNRMRALDGTLRPMFERWYPGLANGNGDGAAQAAAA